MDPMTPAPTEPTEAEQLLARIQNYLGNGGLFNPECMEHDKVRDLIMDLRAYVKDTAHVAAEAAKATAELQRDKERLDWLEKNGNRVKFSKGYILSEDSWCYEDTYRTHHDAESLRQAIDAARAQQNPPT